MIAGGSSKFVCLYDVSEKVLLRKYALSNNVALDGVRMRLNSSRLTDAVRPRDGPTPPPTRARDCGGRARQQTPERCPLRLLFLPSSRDGSTPSPLVGQRVPTLARRLVECARAR